MAATGSVQEKLASSVAAASADLLPIFASGWYLFVCNIVEGGKAIIPRQQLLAKFESVQDEAFQHVIKSVQEAVVLPPCVALAIRPQPGIWANVCVCAATLAVKELSVPAYLKMKEDVIDGPKPLELKPYLANPRTALSILVLITAGFFSLEESTAKAVFLVVAAALTLFLLLYLVRSSGTILPEDETCM